MKQADRELLLKDLCTRLPYGTFVYAQNADDWYDSEICTQGLSDAINEDYVIKPYLFPLSSMTEEQKIIYGDFCYAVIHSLAWDMQAALDELYDWLNKNHFDYRGLIEKGLALDATNLNIY